MIIEDSSIVNDGYIVTATIPRPSGDHGILYYFLVLILHKYVMYDNIIVFYRIN